MEPRHKVSSNVDGSRKKCEAGDDNVEVDRILVTKPPDTCKTPSQSTCKVNALRLR